MSRPPVAGVATVLPDGTDPNVLAAVGGRLLQIAETAGYPDFVSMSRIGEGGPALAFRPFQRRRSPRTECTSI